MKFTCTITSINEIVIVLKQNAQTVTMSAIVNTGIGSPKIGVESFILMIEHILVSILFDLTRATLLSLHNTLTLL